MKLVALLLMFLLATPAYAASSGSTSFTPEAGFGGSSEGTGTLTFIFGKPRPYHVHNEGRVLADGVFRLDQKVVFQGKPPQQRHWLLTTVKPGEYTGTLSDAAGKVSGRTQGPQLTLRYRLKGPLYMHQTLRMMPDGDLDNVGKITLLGISIGHLHETIVSQQSDEYWFGR